MDSSLINSSTPFWTICRQVYLVWAAIIFLGFTGTHLYQVPEINWLWLILSVIGLGFMILQLFYQFQHPQFQDPGMAHLSFIGMVWTLTIALGMTASVLPFLGVDLLTNLPRYLGVYWLFQMGMGHILNGMVNPPGRIYWLTGTLHYGVGIICLFWGGALSIQYLIAGGVGAFTLLILFLFRP